jgi:hypothetical protein
MSATAPAASPVTVQLPNPTQRRRLVSVTLHPGEIGDVEREVFGWGYCHILAAYLHELTGWPFGVLEQLRPYGQWRWAHAGVFAGLAGRFLDIEGVRVSADVEDYYARAVRTSRGSFRWATAATIAEFETLIGKPDDVRSGWWRADLTPAGSAAVESIAWRLVQDADAQAGRP